MELTKKLYEKIMEEVEDTDNNPMFDEMGRMAQELFTEEEEWIKFLKQHLKDQKEFKWEVVNKTIKKLYNERNKKNNNKRKIKE